MRTGRRSPTSANRPRRSRRHRDQLGPACIKISDQMVCFYMLDMLAHASGADFGLTGWVWLPDPAPRRTAPPLTSPAGALASWVTAVRQVARSNCCLESVLSLPRARRA
jgi:hypothetical protein